MRPLAALLLFAPLLQDQEKKPWIGVSMSLEQHVPAVEGTKAKAAISVSDLPPGSPAAKWGVRVGDLIVGIDGKDWDIDPKEIINAFRAAVVGRKAGDVLALRIVRDEIEGLPAGSIEEYVRKHGELTLKHKVSLLEIKVTLEARPADAGSGKQIPEKLDFPSREWPEEALARALIEEKKLGDAYADLRKRLANLHASADAFRLRRCAYVHRNPFQLRAIAEETFKRLDPVGAAAWLDVEVTAPAPLKTGLPFDEHLAQLIERLKTVRERRDAAFKTLSAEDMKFLDQNLDALTDRFREDIYLHNDPDKERYARHLKVLQLAARVDFAPLFQAAAELWAARDPEYLKDLRAAVAKEWEAKGKPGGVFVSRDTEIGKVVVAGHERSWHRDEAALLIDLGGDDFYTNKPALLQIDFGGDDAYEATFAWAQGAGRLGVSALIDVAGNDEYVGTRWAQGAAVLGVGLLCDFAGDDTYRGDTFVQGVALWGIGLLDDEAGADRYEAHYMSQGVGLPGGAGWLVDAKGDDRYYAKGMKPTNYGDAGIFDAWSQGCGLGFRQLASGGVGLVWDGAGADRYEAGNFSQGGGYYFGVGLMRDESGDDCYVGSRYNQGFAAHQAVGFFEDLKGNDTYTTRQGVAQGLAWDECVSFFIDRAGNDTYEGGGFFSQGAAAHNAICVFLDLGGRDRYRYGPGQAQTSGNDYHGGTSFALFLDLGGDADEYEGGDRNGAIRFQGEHGFACDLPAAIEDALKDGAWRKLLK